MLTKQIYRQLLMAGIAVVLVGAFQNLTAQTNVSINATGAVADPSAILDVSSTTSGLLVPRMTEAEKNGIASPVDGLFIWQTDGDIGFWYYDGTALAWVFLSRYMAGNVEMGPAPSTIIQGSGYSVSRLADGTDEISYNQAYNIPPGITLTNAQSDGSAPTLEDYCAPVFNTCGCHYLLQVEVFGGATVDDTPIIVNNPTGCTSAPDAYQYYEAGSPVYILSGDPDLCAGAPDSYSVRYRGNLDPAPPCGVNRFTMWIDWQQDGFFDDMQDNVVPTSPALDWSGGTQSANGLAIPATAYNGDTFMRAMITPNSPGNACVNSTDGETEEYNVHISCRSTAVYDDVPSYCNIGDITQSSFRVSCRRIGGAPRNVQNYYFQINEN